MPSPDVSKFPTGVQADTLIADPGDAAAIPLTSLSPVIVLEIGAGAETNTLGAPLYRGQQVTISAGVVGGGTRAITASAAINQAGNTVMTFGAVSDVIRLEAIPAGAAGALLWRVIYNDGVALS